MKADYEAFVVESKAKIEKIKTDMAAWENMKPIEHMTCEEVLAYPQLADHPVIQAHIQNPDKPRHREVALNVLFSSFSRFFVVNRTFYRQFLWD